MKERVVRESSKEKQEQAKEMENTLKSENINENISIEKN